MGDLGKIGVVAATQPGSSIVELARRLVDAETERWRQRSAVSGSHPEEAGSGLRELRY
jgi:hypothetical protein